MTIAIRPRDILANSELYAQHFLRIQDKSGAVVPFKYNATQRHFMQHRTRRDIIVKARQLGMSTGIQGELNRQANTTASHTLTLADVDDNTQKLRRIQKRFYDNWPDGIPRPLRGEDSAIIATFPEMNSSMSIATAGSRSAGRAGTYHALHGSEVAWWPRPEDTIAGALQAVPHDGWIVLESTPNGAQGWFYETAMESLDGGNAWTVHFYEWWHDPGYAIQPTEPLTYTPEEQVLVSKHNLTTAQINWRRLKVSELKHLFKQEYPEDIHECFLRSGRGYFGDISPVLTSERFTPVDDMHYVAGLDFGQSADYTVLSIGCIETGQQVEVYRINQLPHHDMMRRVMDRCEHWHVSQLLPEYNSIGAVNIEILRNMAAERGMTINIGAFRTTAQSKPPLITGLYHGLHSGALKLLDISELKREFQAFTANQTPSGHWKYEAAQGNHDDIVIATALMYYAMNRPSVEFFEL